MNDELLRYPIGKFSPKDHYSTDEVTQSISQIEKFPQDVEKLARSLTVKQLDTPYREGGWTARQVIHHVADSHLNAYVRTKWILTEETPLIKAYNEKAWAETPEVKLDPGISIDLLKALHTKWVSLLKRINPADYSKALVHPDTKKEMRLDRLIAMYSWHGEHHLGHLKIVAAKS